jgi:hypothetical protein
MYRRVEETAATAPRRMRLKDNISKLDYVWNTQEHEYDPEDLEDEEVRFAE